MEVAKKNLKNPMKEIEVGSLINIHNKECVAFQKEFLQCKTAVIDSVKEEEEM